MIDTQIQEAKRKLMSGEIEPSRYFQIMRRVYEPKAGDILINIGDFEVLVIKSLYVSGSKIFSRVLAYYEDGRFKIERLESVHELAWNTHIVIPFKGDYYTWDGILDSTTPDYKKNCILIHIIHDLFEDIIRDRIYSKDYTGVSNDLGDLMRYIYILEDKIEREYEEYEEDITKVKDIRKRVWDFRRISEIKAYSVDKKNCVDFEFSMLTPVRWEHYEDFYKTTGFLKHTCLRAPYDHCVLYNAIQELEIFDE